MGKGMVIGNRNDGNRYIGNEEWEQGIGMGTKNGERGTGKLKNLYFFLTTMTEAYDKMHFTLFRRRSKTGSKI